FAFAPTGRPEYDRAVSAGALQELGRELRVTARPVPDAPAGGLDPPHEFAGSPGRIDHQPLARRVPADRARDRRPLLPVELRLAPRDVRLLRLPHAAAAGE